MNHYNVYLSGVKNGGGFLATVTAPNSFTARETVANQNLGMTTLDVYAVREDLDVRK